MSNNKEIAIVTPAEFGKGIHIFNAFDHQEFIPSVDEEKSLRS
ncbi:MAG: hypothetical protein O2887_10495 [Bacteroidetes bacterium]|nr:hypothetical protein [Bacteroidota bacterium]MDA1120899.1 hypothetical protein [Bacteroidota bacterium]